MHTKTFLLWVESRLNLVVDTMQAGGYGKNAIRGALRRELRAIGESLQ
jgi:hypothetical protein